MSLIKLAKSQEESKLSELDKIIKMIDEKTTQAKAPVIAQREQSKSRLNQINSEIRRQKSNLRGRQWLGINLFLCLRTHRGFPCLNHLPIEDNIS